MANRPVKLKLLPRSTMKVKSATRLTGSLAAGNGITVTQAGGIWTISVNTSAGIFQLADADLTALAANTGTGIWTVTGTGTGHVRTITGTAAEITVTNGDGVAGNPTLSLPTALTFTGKTITGGTFVSFGATDSATITSTDAGATFGPFLSLYRNSASPAANDVIGAVAYGGNNSTPTAINYAFTKTTILDPTAGSEDSQFSVQTMVAGTLADRITTGQGVQVGAPTGGDKGVGTLNATGLYVNNVAVALSTAGVSSIAGNAGAFTLSGGITNATNDIRVDGVFGFRNRVINPSGQIAQITPASTADGSYTGFDQWLALTQTAAITPSSVTAAENGTPYMMRLTQAQASAQRMGLIQWIEKENCIDLRGQAVVLSARVRMSASTTLRYAIVEWTGTADTITKDIVNDWTSATFTTGNFFTTTSTTVTSTGSTALTANTLTSISLTGTVGSSMNNIAVFFWTDSTQAQNVTLDIAKVQLEIGTSATALAGRPYAQELNACQRYIELGGPGLSGTWETANQVQLGWQYKSQKRISAAITLLTTTPVVTEVAVADRTGSSSALFLGDGSTSGTRVIINGFSSATAHHGAIVTGTAGNIVMANSRL